ncbi:hypothetical protein K488DRAFT_89518 [Vararia minispora EC-137]|uniref:Uncharacterized protein n=1 Tax=Vararia minispora EC-137 TaxID=1314806 RepID=A0ACB8QAG8_9AGAM|nr:hypothetical protein K488DRAFT_89518 [Vararia minispora EC-137]
MASSFPISAVDELRVKVQYFGTWGFPDIMETVLFSAFPTFVLARRLTVPPAAFFTVVIGVSTYTLLEKGLHARVNQVLLAASLTMYAMSAAAWAGHLRILWQDINIALSTTLATAVDAGLVPVEVAQYTRDVPFILLHVCTNVVNVLLGDSIALWRAYAIWGSPRWMLVLSCGLIFTLLCLHIFNAVVYVALDLPTAPADLRYLGDLDGHGGTVICAVTMTWTAFCNVLATALIAHKAWEHWRAIRELLNRSSRRSSVGRIFSILIESGLVYSALWCVNIGASCPGGIHGPVQYYWPLVMSQISGMYPTLIVVIVALRQSQLEHDASDGGADPRRASLAHAPAVTTLSLHFASNPAPGSDTIISSMHDSASTPRDRSADGDKEKKAGQGAGLAGVEDV